MKLKANLSTNIVANLVGRIWSALIGILLVPQYIKFMGIESYGLVGFYTTLISTMVILDFGLSTTVNREIAKAKANEQKSISIKNLVFTLETIYWSIGILIAIVVILCASIISHNWIHAKALSPATVKQSVIVMGLIIAFQWPVNLYGGGLTGLEKIVQNNIILIVMTTVRSVGVLAILKWYSPTIEAFFIWQLIAYIAHVLVMRFILWYYLPAQEGKVVFSKSVIKEIWRFAAGMTGITAITFFLSQIDKILLSKILSLESFGFYMLAYTVASGISIIIGPISTAAFPRIVSQLSAGDNVGIAKLYHQSCKLIACIVFPIGMILIFWGYDILFIWTKNAQTAENAYHLVQVLVIGFVCNSLMVMPYMLLLANGWTKFVIYQNTIASIILVPLLFWWTSKYGPVGAAYVWLIVNAGSLLISLPIIHLKLLKGELKHWYLSDTLLPALIAGAMIVLLKLFLRPIPQLNLFSLVLIGMIVTVPCMLYIKIIRTSIFNIFVIRRS